MHVFILNKPKVDEKKVKLTQKWIFFVLNWCDAENETKGF